MFLWRNRKNRFQLIPAFDHHILHAHVEPCLLCHRTKTRVHLTHRLVDPSIAYSHITLELNHYLCAECIHDIPWITHIVCPKCGRNEQCLDCLRRKHPYFTWNRSAVTYNSTMKQWLAQYKYRKDERLSELFVLMLSFAYEKVLREMAILQQPFDLITYVPISKERLAERGFNQAEQIARGMAKRYDLQVIPLLIRNRHTFKQSVQSRADRFTNLRDVFTIDHHQLERHSEQFCQKKHIFLIDDIYTTGSTLNQCAKVLVQSLGLQVYGLTWARSNAQT